MAAFIAQNIAPIMFGSLVVFILLGYPVAFALAAVSIIGLPPSGGFMGKWMLLNAAVADGQWWWVVVMVVHLLLHHTPHTPPPHPVPRVRPTPKVYSNPQEQVRLATQ